LICPHDLTVKLFLQLATWSPAASVFELLYGWRAVPARQEQAA
jgi:hypothetical protein